MIYKNSFSNHYEHLSKQGSKILENTNVGYASNNHSYINLVANSGQSPFLTKLNKKTVHSRNDNINRVKSSNIQANKSNPLSNIIIASEVSLSSIFYSKTEPSRETVSLT